MAAEVVLLNTCLPAGRFVLKFTPLAKQQYVSEARLAFAVATKTVIKNGLTILGVSAPERM